MAYTLAGTAMKLIDESCVPKIERPAAHHGMRRPPTKKSSLVVPFLAKYSPIITSTPKYEAKVM